MSGYWIQSSGARKGSIQKVQEVQDPGYFSKQLINTTMNLVVNGDDCGTQRGVGMPVSSSEVHDRELAADLKVRGRTFSKGTVLSPDVVGQIRKLDKNAQAVVRSSLKCEHGEGLCQKCAGLSPNGKYYDKGTNMGVISAQSLGERTVQLALKAFHSGGVKAVGGKGTLGAFDRTKQLTLLPKKIPDAATLAMRSGTVTKVESDKTGTNVFIDGEKHFVPRDARGISLAVPSDGKSALGWVPPKKGMKVEAGQQLSDPTRSFVNPHDLYRATNNMEKVQNFLTNELHGIYKPEGVRRQHIETVVKAMSNLTRVRNSGDASGILRGEYQPTSKIRALNADLQKKGKRPVQHSPIMKGIDVMPLTMQEDWMAKLNYNSLTKTLTESAAEGSVSDLHGLHPIPGAAYGAEFGMTKKHQLKKPHLFNVPTWSY
jgi:DNA-directed RNA polymerase subunit beta'